MKNVPQHQADYTKPNDRRGLMTDAQGAVGRETLHMEPPTGGGSESLALAIIGIYVVVTTISPYMYGGYIATPLAVAAVLMIVRGRLPVPALAWTLALTILGIVGAVHGLIRMNPGAVPTLSIYVVEPLVLGILFGSAMGKQGWESRLPRILDISLIAVTGVGLAVYLGTDNQVSLPAWIIDPRWAYGDLSEGTLRTNYQGFNSLVFLAPYGFWRAGSDRSLGWLWRGALLAAATVAVLIAGRRVLYIAVPVAILFTALISRSKRAAPVETRLPRRLAAPIAIAILGLAAAAGILGISSLDALNRAAMQFTLGDEEDARYDQGDQILAGWINSPLFGAGSGASLDGYSRSGESPWAFELSYHTVLLNFGLVGFVLLAAWGIWIVLGLRQGFSYPRGASLAGAILCGFIGTVIATYTNPYVQKLDGMWMLFLPFGAAAYWRESHVLNSESETARER